MFTLAPCIPLVDIWYTPKSQNCIAVFGGSVLFLTYICGKTVYIGLHSTPNNVDSDGLHDTAPSYCSYDCLLVNGALAASYYTDYMTEPSAVLVEFKASADILLNSKASPRIL